MVAAAWHARSTALQLADLFAHLVHGAMTESPLDRATRALEDALQHEVSGLPSEVYREAVRRVFQAIREPSEEALNALGYVQQRHFTEIRALACGET
jgi:hypothetical protein